MKDAGPGADHRPQTDLPAQPDACPEELLEPPKGGTAGGRAGPGLPEGCLDVYKQREMERFSGLISEKGARRVSSEYHKEGAPYMEGGDDPAVQSVSGAGAGTTKKEVAGIPGGAGAPVRATESLHGRRGGLGGLLDRFPTDRISGAIDVSTIEIGALTLFRAFFGQGLAIPVKQEGLVDMNIVVMGKDIVINTNRLMLELPELTIWRVLFTYKGRPILEYGRGVPNKIKVHRFRALMLLAGMWWHGLTSHDAQSERISGRAVALMMRREAKKKAKREARARAAEARQRRRGGKPASQGTRG